MNKAPVNRILPYSVVDGPGNRVAIFLQGCNLRCAYCHNPETQTLCTACGRCVPVCPKGALEQTETGIHWHPERCCKCDQCIQTCPQCSDPRVQWMTPEMVMEQVRRSIPFIRGITVSGGECTLYPAFLAELFTLAHAEGLTCLLDSNGMCDLSAAPALMRVCDGVMLDVKAWDSRVHQALTSMPNEMVKKNLRYLAEHGLLTELRVVNLPGQVDVEAVLQGIPALLGREIVADIPLKLIRFRPMGVRGPAAQLSSPAKAEMEHWAQVAAGEGFHRVIIL